MSPQKACCSTLITMQSSRQGYACLLLPAHVACSCGVCLLAAEAMRPTSGLRTQSVCVQVRVCVLVQLFV